MIKITKKPDEVIVELPIRSLTFSRLTFDKISDNIYFIYRLTPTSLKIIREKGNIEELNMGHWLSLYNKHQTNFNDRTIKSLDVSFLIKEKILTT